MNEGYFAVDIINKKSHAIHGLFLKNKGMGEIFHDQTKGFKFVCDSLHKYKYTSLLNIFQVLCSMFHIFVTVLN